MTAIPKKFLMMKKIILFAFLVFQDHSQLIIICSKSTMETAEQCAKPVQS